MSLVCGDNPVAGRRLRLAHDHDDNVSLRWVFGEAARKQTGAPDPPASAHEIRVREDLGDPLDMRRQQIGVPVGDVARPLLRELDLGAEIWA
jgi:hypothetical protein